MSRLVAALIAAGSLAAAGASAGKPRHVWRIRPVLPPTDLGVVVQPQLAASGSLVRAQEARSRFAVNGNGLTVAVVDSGARTTHADFVGKLRAGVNFTSDNGGNPGNAADGNGHGTHMAGIITANGVHTGIAPGAGLAVLKVLRHDGSGDSDTLDEALDWVIANRAAHAITVVNLSLGDGSNHVNARSDSTRTRVQALRAAGVAVVVAAGNQYWEYGGQQGMNAPAVYPESVSVGCVFDADVGRVSYGGPVAASTGPDRITPFSQRLHPLHAAAPPPNRTDVFAPGAPVRATGISSDGASSTQHGTSQATAVVSGVILLLQEFHLRRFGALPTVDQIESWLRAGAVRVNDGDDEDDNVPNTGLDFLRVDAVRALEAIGNTYTASGRVTYNNSGLAAVTVSAAGRTGVSAADGTYTIADLGPGSYTVTAAKAGFGFSPASRAVSVGPSAAGVDFLAVAAPARPTGLQAQLAQPREVLLTWQDMSSDEHGFRIEVSRAGGVFAEIRSLGANVTSAVIGNLARSTPYVFRVRAYNSVGPSEYSNEAPITTPGAPPRPPKRLRAALEGKTQIRLTWRDVSADELGFKIETAPKGGTFAQIAAVGPNVTTFTASGLAPGTAHRFRVRAYNAGGDSRYSNTAKRKTP